MNERFSSIIFELGFSLERRISLGRSVWKSKGTLLALHFAAAIFDRTMVRRVRDNLKTAKGLSASPGPLVEAFFDDSHGQWLSAGMFSANRSELTCNLARERGPMICLGLREPRWRRI